MNNAIHMEVAIFVQLQVYLLVTQSVFWPSSRIAARFDLKGCLAGRTERVDNDNSSNNNNGSSSSNNNGINNNSNVEEEFVVLKDGNFIEDGVHVDLGGSNRWWVVLGPVCTMVESLSLNRPLLIAYVIVRFSEQLSRDVTFLRSVGAVDYSLLLGIQPLSTSAIRARQSRYEHEQDDDDVSQMSMLTPEAGMDQAKYASAIKR